MAKQFEALNEEHSTFIAEQSIFFVGTAASDGRVNVSPKGMDSLRVLSPDRILWLNLTGSGNETAGHVARHNRMTLMWCSFSKAPLILRCYGTATVSLFGDENWQNLARHFPDMAGERQIFDVSLDLVQTSCGWAVPQMDLVAPRKILQQFSETRGQAAIEDEWLSSNMKTIDGFDAPIPKTS